MHYAACPQEYFANMGGGTGAIMKSAHISALGLLIIVFYLARCSTTYCTVQVQYCTIFWNIIRYCGILHNIVNIGQYCGILYHIVHWYSRMYCIALHSALFCDALYCNAWWSNRRYCSASLLQMIAKGRKQFFGRHIAHISNQICTAASSNLAKTGTLLEKQRHKPLIFNYFAFQEKRTRKKIKINRYLLIFKSSAWRRQILPILHIVLGSKHFHCLLNHIQSLHFLDGTNPLYDIFYLNLCYASWIVLKIQNIVFKWSINHLSHLYIVEDKDKLGWIEKREV